MEKVYTNIEKVRKNCLPKAWRPKVAAIEEANILATLDINLLLGSLEVHEQVVIEEFQPKKKSCCSQNFSEDRIFIFSKSKSTCSQTILKKLE